MTPRPIPDFATANHDLTQRLEVLYDGTALRDVVTYSLVEQWVDVIVRDTGGKLVVDRASGTVKIERLWAHRPDVITVRWKEAVA